MRHISVPCVKSTIPNDTFRRGDSVTIGSAFRVLRGASLDTSSGVGEVEFRSTIGAEVFARAKACIFVCIGPVEIVQFGFSTVRLAITITNQEDYVIDIQSVAERMLEGDVEAFLRSPEGVILIDIVGKVELSQAITFARLAGFTPGQFNFYLSNFTKLGCCSGYLGLPNVSTSSRVENGRVLVASGSDEFSRVQVDPIAFVSLRKPWDKIPLSFSVEACQLASALPCDLNLSLAYTIISVPIGLSLTQNETFRFDPTPRAQLQFPQAVDFSVSPCDPLLVCSGTSNLVVFNLGSSVTFTYPDVHKMDVTPTILLPHRLSNDVITNLDLFGTIKIADFDLSTPEIDLGFLGSIDPIHLHLGPLVEKSIIPAGIGISDSSFFDGDRAPWVLPGILPVGVAPLALDAEIKPTAVITGPPPPVKEGQEAAFSGSQSTDPDGELLTFIWEFGDGISDFGENVSHE